MIEFAIAHRGVLFVVDAVACVLIALSAVFLMQVTPRAARYARWIGQPWPWGVETALRASLGTAATAAFFVPALYLSGKIHFVLIEEVIIHASLGLLGTFLAIFRGPIFGR